MNGEKNIEEQKCQSDKENYVPKLRIGDVEIPNRIFVKGFPKDSTADDVFSMFEEYGKVLECRIVADRYGYSKGFGFITFDSQNVAEKVREMERIKFSDDIEVVIGPARVRKKKFFNPTSSPQHVIVHPQQVYTTTEGNMVYMAPQQPIIHQLPVMQQQQTYSPVMMSYVQDVNKVAAQPCVSYQTVTSPPTMSFVERVSPVKEDELQQVPAMVQQPAQIMATEAVMYGPYIPLTHQKRTII